MKPEEKNALILSECEAYFTKFSEKHFSVISLLHLQVHIIGTYSQNFYQTQ